MDSSSIACLNRGHDSAKGDVLCLDSDFSQPLHVIANAQFQHLIWAEIADSGHWWRTFEQQPLTQGDACRETEDP